MHNGRARPLVLVVEDDVANRVLLGHLLERGGYDSISVGDGRDGLRAAIDESPDLLLLDIELPGMNGLEVCRALRADPRTVTTPIILLTGRTSTEDVVTGLDAGADDFLRKPYDRMELMARVRSVLRLAGARAETDDAHNVIAALANAVEAKDEFTERHCQRLAGLAHQLGMAVGLEPTELRGLIFGALLHDVGKIGIRDAILSKPGPLTPSEWDEMRMHPIIGERICQPLASSRIFGPIVRHHHERWDGLGYPDRLRGEAIPIGARIVGIVDAFDAIVVGRPYRAARTADEAAEELTRQGDKQFDRELVARFLPLVMDRNRTGMDEIGLVALRALPIAI